MTSLRQLRANRANSLRSTGPRTAAGLARSAGNALKVGLFSRLLVVQALGESAAECDAFRAAVLADLGAAGAVERELADRAAGLMWRLRRVARHEAAAVAVTAGELPPHPDYVTPLAGNEVYLPVPADAPAAYKLAHLRARTGGSAAALAARRAAVEALAPGVPNEHPIDAAVAGRVLDAAADELGWPAGPDRWPSVLTSAGLGGDQPGREWTAARLGAALAAAAGTADRPAGALRAAVRERLVAAFDELERAVAERRGEEAVLVAEVLAARERAAAAQAYADDALVLRVVRAEGHLSRELDRVLALLARLQGGREGEPPAVRTIGLVVSDRGAREPLRLPAGVTG